MSLHVLIPPPLLKQNGYRTYTNSSFQSSDLAAYSLLVYMSEIQSINSLNSAFDAKTEIKEALNPFMFCNIPTPSLFQFGFDIKHLLIQEN